MSYVIYSKGLAGGHAIPIDTVSWIRLLDLALKYGWQPRGAISVTVDETFELELSDEQRASLIFPAHDTYRQPNLLAPDSGLYAPWQSADWSKFALSDYRLLSVLPGQATEKLTRTEKRNILRRTRNAILDDTAMRYADTLITQAKLSRWQELGGYLYVPPVEDAIRCILPELYESDEDYGSYDDDTEDEEVGGIALADYTFDEDEEAGEEEATTTDTLDVWAIDAEDRCALAAALRRAMSHISPHVTYADESESEYVQRHSDEDSNQSDTSAIQCIDVAIRLTNGCHVSLHDALYTLSPEDYFSGEDGLALVSDVAEWFAYVEPATFLTVQEVNSTAQLGPEARPQCQLVVYKETHVHTPCIVMSDTALDSLLELLAQKP